MDAQRYRQHLLEGVIGMKDFLFEIEKVSNSEERQKQIKEEYTKWEMHLYAVISKPNEVHYEEPGGLEEYEQLLNKIKKLSKETTNNSQNSNQSQISCDYCHQTTSEPYLKKYCGVKCALSWGIGQFSQLITQKINSLSSQVKSETEKLKGSLEEAKKDIDIFWSSPEKLRWVVESGTKLESYLPWELWAIWKPLKYACENRIGQLSSQSTSNDNSSSETNYRQVSCQQCYQEIKSGKSYWYHKSKNDGYKFCSANCYDEFYGEYCNKCLKKFLTTYQWENNPYCSTCYELVKKKGDNSNITVHCRFCNAECPQHL